MAEVSPKRKSLAFWLQGILDVFGLLVKALAV
jgi:hypothetical protein